MYELVDYPNLGTEVREFPGNIRRLVADQHVIFYETDDRSITILRILHIEMDLPLHLYRN